MLAAMPVRIVGGMIGLQARESRPGSPTVVRKRVTTRNLRRHGDQILHAHDLETAAAISGVSPGARPPERFACGSSDSSQSRNSPTVRCEIGAKARRRAYRRSGA